ncbi:MAG TPA: MazG-like family protein [Candidatus Woesebacteria bacterium]|nr:MazG-like family protein [Candidatus Shapirobacteria bacterium]HOR01877.1 MazG-like family protein [Candidatus Woesebacteria bacterium]
MKISDIQKWERDFSLRKGIAQDEEKSLKIATLKLSEEVGEVCKAILEKKWEEVPAEITDVIVFACKIANIAEDFHNTKKLEKVLKKKLEYSETRKYNPQINKMNKPPNKDFK